MTQQFPGKRELVCELRLRKHGRQDCCLHPSLFQHWYIYISVKHITLAPPYCITDLPFPEKLNCKTLHQRCGVAERRDRHQNHGTFQENGSKCTSSSRFCFWEKTQAASERFPSDLRGRRIIPTGRIWALKINVLPVSNAISTPLCGFLPFVTLKSLAS